MIDWTEVDGEPGTIDWIQFAKDKGIPFEVFRDSILLAAMGMGELMVHSADVNGDDGVVVKDHRFTVEMVFFKREPDA